MWSGNRMPWNLQIWSNAVCFSIEYFNFIFWALISAFSAADSLSLQRSLSPSSKHSHSHNFFTSFTDLFPLHHFELYFSHFLTCTFVCHMGFMLCFALYVRFQFKRNDLQSILLPWELLITCCNAFQWLTFLFCLHSSSEILRQRAFVFSCCTNEGQELYSIAAKGLWKKGSEPQP